MGSPCQTIGSLDDVLPRGAEAMLATSLQKNLLDGVVVGIFCDGKSYCRVVGAGLTPDSMFEIGSLTKTFTAELLSILVKRARVHLNDPVETYLPGCSERGSSSRPISFLDLATHHSGLPRLPSNFHSALSPDPYARYSRADLDRFLQKTPLWCRSESGFLYSNLGFTVLGCALAAAAGMSYEELLTREILSPLGLRETALALSGKRPPEIVAGHSQTGQAASRWTFDVCAPAGALCSNIRDQLKWIEFLLTDPDRQSLRPHASAGNGEIGLGWMIRPGGESCWHNGGTGGFSSYLAVHRRLRCGVAILANRHASSLVTALGTNIERLLCGQPPLQMSGDYGMARARLLLPIQKYLVGPIVTFSRLPAWARFPIAISTAYGIMRLVQILIRH